MFHLYGVFSKLVDENGDIVLPTGIKLSLGIADVSADAFGTNRSGDTGGLNIELINASGYLGVIKDEGVGIEGELVLFKVGGYIHDEDGKTLFEFNIGYGSEKGYSASDIIPIKWPMGLLIDLTIAGIPIF